MLLLKRKMVRITANSNRVSRQSTCANKAPARPSSTGLDICQDCMCDIKVGAPIFMLHDLCYCSEGCRRRADQEAYLCEADEATFATLTCMKRSKLSVGGKLSDLHALDAPASAPSPFLTSSNLPLKPPAAKKDRGNYASSLSDSDCDTTVPSFNSDSADSADSADSDNETSSVDYNSDYYYNSD